MSPEAPRQYGPCSTPRRVTLSRLAQKQRLLWIGLCATWALPAAAQAPEAGEPSPTGEAWTESEPTTAPADAAPAAEPSTAAANPSGTEPAPDVEGAAVEGALPDAPPAEEGTEEFKPTFTIGAGMRTGLRYTLSGPAEGELRLDDGLVDQAHIRPFMAGQLLPEVGYFVQFEVGTPNGLGNFAILDAIAQLKFLDELQVWVGQHIPANDRNNMNGPFFGNGWNFAIAVEEYPFDVGARDRGATVWGLISGGLLKYHLSVVDLQPGQQAENARVAGRLTLHLLEPEDFYYNSGTYFGTKDVLALGAVFHSQKGVDVPPSTDPTAPPPNQDNDLFGYSFDLLFEKNLEKAGTFTAEGGYWNYEGSGNGYIVNQGTVDQGLGVAGPYPGTAYMGVVSWLTPDKIGPGQIQPNFRVQYAKWEPETRLVFDAGLAYVVDGFNHKYHFNYRHQKTEPAGGGESVSADMIQFGVQYLMSN